MLRSRMPLRSCLFSALILVAVSCSTSGTKESANESSTTVGPVATTTSTTDAPTTTSTRPAAPTTTDPEPDRRDDSTDEVLDSLMEDCVTGIDEACDFLYLVSDADTVYEDVGNTCGERGDGTEYCTPGLELNEGRADPDSTAVKKLVADCESGASMHSCDLLYMVSEYDSVEEEIGDTCGGRIPEGADPACFVALGLAVEP